MSQIGHDLSALFRAANEGNISELMTYLNYDRNLIHKRDQNDDCLIHIAVTVVGIPINTNAL
jgi:hypothetical protein